MKILNLTDRQRHNEYRYEVAVGGGEPSLDYPYSINTLITSGSDDTEEDLTDNSVSDAGSYLGLGYESGTEQITGIRFPNLNIPKGATITNAYIQFSNRLNVTGATSIAIQCEAEDNATAFANTTSNLSNRILTTSSVTWSPNDWSTTDARTPNEATNNISEIIQEVVDRVGYTSSSAINIIMSLISGTGRIAHSYNHSATTCPEIFIEYSLPYEIDAYKFIQSVETTDTLTSTQKTAIDDLVVGLKANGTWSKYKAIYPFIGGTATAHKWNLKDPFDLDVSFRLTYTGTITHDANGITGDGSTGYADTNMNASTILTVDNTNVAFYSKTQLDDGINIEAVSGVNRFRIYATTLYNEINFDMYNDSSGRLKLTGTTDLRGYWQHSRTSSTSAKAFKNGVQQGVTDTDASGSALPNTNIKLSGPVVYSAKTIAFTVIGDSLTETEVFDDAVVIENFQLSLSRSIVVTNMYATDFDAQKFVYSVPTLTQAQQIAIDDLVIGLKANGTWSKYKAIYPMIGGNAESHKYNLKDPRDSDNAFRLGINGGWTHDASGMEGDGATSYADTFMVFSNELTHNNFHFAYYNTSASTTSGDYTMGCSDTINSRGWVSVTNNAGSFSFVVERFGETNDSSYPVYDKRKGYFLGSIIGNQQSAYFLNETSYKTDLRTNTYVDTVDERDESTNKVLIGAYGQNGNPSGHSFAKLCFSSIGLGLTSTEALNDSVLIQEYQEALGRAISIGTEKYGNDNAGSPSDTDSVGATTGNFRWTNVATNLTSVSSDSYDGTYSLLIESTGTGASYGQYRFEATDTKKYLISFWYKCNTYNTQRFRALSGWIENGQTDALTSTTWKRYTTILTADGTGVPTVYFYSGFVGSVGDQLFVDKVSIIELD